VVDCGGPGQSLQPSFAMNSSIHSLHGSGLYADAEIGEASTWASYYMCLYMSVSVSRLLGTLQLGGVCFMVAGYRPASGGSAALWWGVPGLSKASAVCLWPRFQRTVSCWLIGLNGLVPGWRSPLVPSPLESKAPSESGLGSESCKAAEAGNHARSQPRRSACARLVSCLRSAAIVARLHAAEAASKLGALEYGITEVRRLKNRRAAEIG